MIDYEYYYDQYRRIPKNSAHIQRDLTDYHSTVSPPTYNFLSRSIKQPVTTTYIDGSTLLGSYESSYSMKDSFPKGKGRRKPPTPCEKKINTGDVFMSLLPTEKITLDPVTIRSEKIRSPLSLTTATHSSIFPDVQRKSADIRNKRIYSATVFDDENSEAKFYGRCATTHANGAWVRRYKSINKSQTLTDLLRDPIYREKILLKKRLYQQSCPLSSSSIFASPLTRRRRTKY